MTDLIRITYERLSITNDSPHSATRASQHPASQPFPRSGDGCDEAAPPCPGLPEPGRTARAATGRALAPASLRMQTNPAWRKRCTAKTCLQMRLAIINIYQGRMTTHRSWSCACRPARMKRAAINEPAWARYSSGRALVHDERKLQWAKVDQRIPLRSASRSNAFFISFTTSTVA